MIEIKSITTLSEFTEDVQRLVKQGNLTHLDAIVAWCEQRGIDVEQVIPLVKKSQVIKAKLESEASMLNLIAKSDTLPI
jgi:hypothetical protein